jgi:hypothetical protein
MQELSLAPYSILEYRQFPQEVKLVIKKADFQKPFQDGKITFFIAHCDFKKLIIENLEDIDFPDISLSFTG